MDQDITLLQALEGFFASNPQTYYLITDLRNNTTILRVDDLDQQAINTEEFILDGFGEIEFSYRQGDYRLDFTSNGSEYYLFGYDEGVVSI